MIQMVEVKTKAQRKKFINFQNQLYRNVPQYVPSMISDELNNLNPDINPAFDYCDMRFWLAYREGRIVGRVGAILSKAANAKFDQKRMRITRIDFIDDAEVADALIATVEGWAKELGMTEMIGPIGYCDLDKQGMLIDGFEEPSMFITYYNHPYYVKHFERMGFVKEVDWVENRVYIEPEDPERMAKLDRISQRVLNKLGIEVKFLKKRKDIAPYVEKVLGVVNVAFRNLFGVVPLPERQMRYYASQFVPLINVDYLVLLEKDKELVGVGLLAPSLADAMRKCQGRLFPFGWIHVLRTVAKPKVLDMFFVGVLDEYKNAGLPAVMLSRMLQHAQENGVAYAETGPELEENYKVQALWKGLKRDRNCRTRRCWVRPVMS